MTEANKAYLVYHKKQTFRIEADYVMENYKTNRMSFFTGEHDFADPEMNPLVASFPLSKTSIIKILTIKQ